MGSDGKEIGHYTPLVKTTISILELEFIPKPYGTRPSLKDSSWFESNLSFILLHSFLWLKIKLIITIYHQRFISFFFFCSVFAGTLRQDLNIQAQSRAPGRTLLQFQSKHAHLPTLPHRPR